MVGPISHELDFSASERPWQHHMRLANQNVNLAHSGELERSAGNPARNRLEVIQRFVRYNGAYGVVQLPVIQQDLAVHQNGGVDRKGLRQLPLVRKDSHTSMKAHLTQN